MHEKLIVLQEDKYDCAAAALLSIIRYYKGNLDIEVIREIINTTKNGTNAYDLINGAKEIGLDGQAKKIDFKDLINVTKVPFIAHVKKDNMYHFVVIYKIDTKKKKLLIMDPGVGLITKSFLDFEKDYLNVIIMFSKVKELPKIKTQNKLLKIIIKTLLKNKTLLLILSFLSLITFIFSLIDFLIIKLLLENSDIYFKYIFIFLSFIVIKNILIFIRNNLSIKINYDLENKINNETLNNVFNLPYSYYKNKSTGEVVCRINDLYTLKELLSSFILNTFVNILLILISFILMFITNKYLTIISFAIIILYIFIVNIFRPIFKTKVKELQESKGKYNQLLQESIDNIESISNLNIKPSFINKLTSAFRNESILSRKINKTFNFEHFFKNLVYDLGFIFYLTLASIMVIKNKITYSELIILYMLSTYFVGTIKSILDKDLDIYFTLKSISRVNSLFLHNEDRTDTKLMINGDIEINNLCFKYSDNLLIDKLNLNIKKGSKVLLTGKSGCGKSTLMKIILKYLNQYEGIIKINKKDIKNINKGIISNSFTYVGQNEMLFTDTFKNNILLDRTIDNSMYEKVISICCLDEVRNKNSFKDEMLIEENGFNLSGGERQRIILARALLKDFNYLIIDEALSEVDYFLERKIIENLFNNYKDKTIIYISHKEEIKNNFKTIFNIERRNYE